MTSELSPYYFNILAEFLRKESGIVLKPEKSYSLRSKLRPLVAEWGFDSLNDLVLHVQRERHDPEVVDAILNALTIKETSFFRDDRPFRVLRERIVPELAEQRGRQDLKLWSAACSTGQEAVSLAILLRETLPPERADRSEVLGTDVSEDAIAYAEAGVYSGLEMRRGLDEAIWQQYFEPGSSGYRPVPAVRRMMRYRALNILNPDFPLPRFDIVLCRNVLIYFDDDGKAQALDTVYKRLANDGYLLTGAGEDAQRMDPRFERVRIDGVQCYRKAQAS